MHISVRKYEALTLSRRTVYVPTYSIYMYLHTMYVVQYSRPGEILKSNNSLNNDKLEKSELTPGGSPSILQVSVLQAV